MGAGRYSADMHTTRLARAKATGTDTFAYSSSTLRRRREEWKVHETLDPKRTNNNGPFAGQITREAADSTEHPTTVPIVVFLDETGSMRTVPRIVQEHLSKLLGNLQQVNGVDHPQILFGAVGDVKSDRVPLQIGQFESDNRMDEHLSNIVLEGNGGGGDTCESYDLALYFLARHTHIDSFDKRGQKGYAFIIGDEYPRDEVDPAAVNEVIGDGLQGTISIEDIVAEVQQKWELFLLSPTNTSRHSDTDIRARWEGLLGKDHVITLDNPADIADVIGTEVGVREAAKGAAAIAAGNTP